ncbi:PH (Pleckstrin Homology) domain-containing protein [Kribbella steppae]|uniref:PH (Pleckstrin Homology) domain-containing protein n=1 Tax=Kribbella steppae TaxID=2512223 RepID=A0A4R2HPB9_9ACTN|nr:FHA domain-containing protein [Kribbella steppae]TCO33002.1 PH (Pleckstrin Homology) domain-containing protein [Kribbella steppae]
MNQQGDDTTRSITSASLCVDSGPALGTIISVPVEPLILGRTGGVSFLRADPEVSRRHAQVRATRDGHIEVEDLDSANGTYVNDKRVWQSVRLNDGDTLIVGSTHLTALLPQRTIHGVDWLAEGQRLLEGAQPVASRQAFSRALSDSGDPAGAHYGLGMVALVEGDVAAAANSFRSALTIHPRHSNALYQLGAIAERQGDIEAARQLYRSAIEVNASHAGAQSRLRALGLPAAVQSGPPPAEQISIDPIEPGVLSLLKQDPSLISRQTVELISELEDEVSPRFAAYVGRYFVQIGCVAALGGILAAFVLADPYNGGGHSSGLEDSSGSAGGLFVVALFVMAAVALGCYALVKTTRVRIAQGRLQIERGILHRRLDNVDLWRVLNVNLDRTLVNRLTGDGTLEFTLSLDQSDESRRGRKNDRIVKVTGIAEGKDLVELHQRLLNLTFLLRGNPIIKGIIQ